MKTLVLSISVLLLTSSPVFAHCGVCGVGDAKGSAKEMKAKMKDNKVEMMKKDLGLSDEQAKKVEAIMKAKMDKKKDIHEKAEEEMEGVKSEYMEKLEEVLTPEQMKKYKNSKKGSMKGSMKGSAHDHHHHDHE